MTISGRTPSSSRKRSPPGAGSRNADEACILLASITLLAYRRALDLWLNGPTNGDLAKLITKEFDIVSRELSG